MLKALYRALGWLVFVGTMLLLGWGYIDLLQMVAGDVVATYLVTAAIYEAVTQQKEEK